MADQHVPLVTVIKKVAQMANYNSNAKKHASKHNLDIVNISWEDNARFKNSIYGPCISDITLQVNNTNMPIIRESNYSDKTWDVSINKIPIVIGNQLHDEKQNELQTITLKEYLSHFDEYITKPIENTKINLLRNNNKDTHILMSSQCCFLPIESSKQTQFNISIFNYQSIPKHPAVLVIISTSKGTSAQIIEGNQQILFFNNYGKKAYFMGQRLTDNRKEKQNVNINAAMNKMEKKENCIVIIQIPLKQNINKNNNNKPLFPMFYSGMNSKDDNYKHLQKRSLPVEDVNVESAVIKIKSSLYPLCICGEELQKYQLQYAYMNGNDLNAGKIHCDGCDQQIIGKTEIVWHCTREKSVNIHKFGYDLCEECGEKQLIYDELNGVNTIERDERYPIRVTLQYYKATDNGIINENIMKNIKDLLCKSQKQADFIGSLVVSDEKINNNINRPTEPEFGVDNNNNNLNINNIGYKKLYEALKKFGGKDWNKYYEKCLDEEVNDMDVLNLTDEDLKELIPKIGPRSRIKKWIQNRKQNESGTDFMEGLL